MIQGYPEESSVFPGGNITLGVSTDAPWFRIDTYRQGAALKLLSSSTWLPGSFAADHQNGEDWGNDGTAPDGSFAAGWAKVAFDIPAAWETGVYILMFVEGDQNKNPRAPLPDTTTADARTGKAMIVVKNPNPGVSSQLLYKVPLFTYQAYNAAGGSSIYQLQDVHFHRPGGGTGGTPWDAANFPDNFDSGKSPRQTFAHWDAPFIAWLEGAGYRIDYCTDLDVHREGIALLSSYGLVLSVGHDEYYTQALRSALEAFRDGGGNIALVSGNVCWWRADFAADDPLRMLGQQTIQNWSSSYVGQPEDSLTGVSFRNAGWGQDRPPIGFKVQHTEQWPFEGTGLSQGNVIGQKEAIVGYECDGAPCDATAPLPIRPDFSDPKNATPAGLMILGAADTSQFNDPLNNHTATMAMYTQSGTVVSCAAVDWPRVALTNPQVGRITRNIIDRLGGNPKGLANLAVLKDLVACDGFFTPDDDFRHAITGAQSGAITEIFYNPAKGQGQSVVDVIPDLVDIAGFWSADDKMRHVITADKGGAIWETYFDAATKPARTKIASLAGAFRVSAFYSADDQFRHAIVVTADGQVREVFYHPVKGTGIAPLGTFSDIVDVGAFYSPDDQRRHAIVALQDGTIVEIYYHPSTGVSRTTLASVPGVRRIAAYFAGNDAFFTRRVVAVTDRSAVELRYDPRFGIQRTILIQAQCQDVGAFFSADDGFRHAIMMSAASSVQELFFRP